MNRQDVHTASHSAWQIHYHVVFPVKYRRGLLDDGVVGIITQTAKEIQERYDIEFEQIGCDRDHIHLLCSAHPKVAPGQIARIFKSLTARELFRRKPELKRALWGGAFWSAGYYVATVGERGDWSVVERYVKNQGNPKDDYASCNYFDIPAIPRSLAAGLFIERKRDLLIFPMFAHFKGINRGKTKTHRNGRRGHRKNRDVL